MKPYYHHAGVTIFHADCRVVLPLLSGVDVTVTDPPYGVTFEGKRTKSGGGRCAELGYGSDFVDDAAYIDSVVVPVIEECPRRFGRVVVMPGNRSLYRYPPPDAGKTWTEIVFGCDQRTPRMGKDVPLCWMAN